MWFIKKIILIQVFVIFVIMTAFTETTQAKSVYVINDTASSQVQAYKIEDANLVHQADYLCESGFGTGTGAVGLAIDKSDYGEFLFVTFENQDEIEVMPEDRSKSL